MLCKTEGIRDEHASGEHVEIAQARSSFYHTNKRLARIKISKLLLLLLLVASAPFDHTQRCPQAGA
jgi:hypothetical protein